jgi:S-adenosylmethionine hydrolase
VAARTFGEARTGDIVLYEDAYANIALAINRGNAAQMFSVRVGDELRLSSA